MNLALGALILLLLLFPGILFRFAYLNGPYSRKNFQSSFSDEIMLSLIPAFVIQCLAYLSCVYLFRITVHIRLLTDLISGNTGNDNTRLDLLSDSIPFFFFFTCIVSLIGLCAGKLARYLVKRYNLDLKYFSLRFNNDWYYLLSGQMLDYPNAEGNSRNIHLVESDVLVETSEGTYIYSGILQEFYLSKNDGLDRIYLSNVYRRKLTDDLPEEVHEPDKQVFEDRYYNMPGDLFVIPYSQIKNINITYYAITEED